MAEWKEFDFDKRVWEVPIERMKMRRPHLVPLSYQVVAAPRELQAVTGRYNLVFPGRNDITKPMSEASINQVLKRIGYHGKATGHGFRHTMSTILHERGYNTAWIELQLAHVDKNTIRGTYNHAQYLEQRREMLQWYGDYVCELDSQGTGSVVGFRTKECYKKIKLITSFSNNITKINVHRWNDDGVYNAPLPKLICHKVIFPNRLETSKYVKNCKLGSKFVRLFLINSILFFSIKYSLMSAVMIFRVYKYYSWVS